MLEDSFHFHFLYATTVQHLPGPAPCERAPSEGNRHDSHMMMLREGQATYVRKYVYLKSFFAQVPLIIPWQFPVPLRGFRCPLLDGNIVGRKSTVIVP